MDELDNWEHLTERLRAGDPEATRWFWERYGPDIQHVVERRWTDTLRVKEDGADVVQSIFRTVFRRLRAGQFECKDAESLFVLLFVIARRKIAKKARHYLAGLRDVRREVHGATGPAADGGGYEPVEHALTPEEALEREELLEEFRGAIASLKERERQVVELMLQEKKTSEIAEELDVCPELVTRYKRSAMQNLKRKLKEV